jgi:hypothetical protein
MEGLYAYMYPPTTLIRATLSKLVSDKADLILIAPDLIKMSIDFPLELPVVPKLLFFSFLFIQFVFSAFPFADALLGFALVTIVIISSIHITFILQQYDSDNNLNYCVAYSLIGI